MGSCGDGGPPALRNVLALVGGLVRGNSKGACRLVREGNEKLEPTGAGEDRIRCLRCSGIGLRNEVSVIRIANYAVPLCRHCWNVFWNWLPSQGLHEGCFDPPKEGAGQGARFCTTCRLEFERWLGPAASHSTDLGRSTMARQGKKAKGPGRGTAAAAPLSQPSGPPSQVAQTAPSGAPCAAPATGNGTCAPKKEQP